MVIIDRIIILSLFGISSVFGLFTLIIALKNKYYKQLLSEFMIYVMISEMLYSISRFFCLTRENIEEQLGPNLAFNMIQIFASVACDIWTLLSTLFISFKIIDGILNESKIFSKKSIQITSRVIIFIFSFGLAIIFGVLQIYLYKDEMYNSKHPQCNVLSCQLSSGLNDYVVYFIICLTFLILSVILAAIIYLKVKLFLLNKKGRNAQTSNINAMQCKLWIYPIVSCAFWAWRFIYQLANLGQVPIGVIWLYSISNGLRTAIYSLVFILSNNELMIEIKKIFGCFTERESSIVESLQDNTAEEVMIESRIMDPEDDILE